MKQELVTLTRSEKVRIGTTEIARLIRKQLRSEFPKFKWSVTSKYYSGGSSITLALMESPIRIKKTVQEITEKARNDYASRQYTDENLKYSQENDYHQLNQYQLLEDFNDHAWCNGLFLTKQGHGVMQRAIKIAHQYNYDESDTQIDYFDVNFYLHPELGKWNKPFKEATK